MTPVTLPKLTTASLVQRVASVSPWLAPVIPAYMAYGGMIDKLGFHAWAAFIGALVIECIGITAVYTTLELWKYNASKRKSDPAEDMRLPVALSVFYFVVILLVNVVLDIGTLSGWVILARFLLSTLSIVSALILAIRANHERTVEEIERGKNERRTRTPVKRTSKPAEFRYPCEFCDFGTDDQRAYAGHMRKHNGKNGKGK